MKKVGLVALINVFIVISVLFGIKVSAKEMDPYEECLKINNYLLANIDELNNSYNSNNEDKLSVKGFDGYSLVKILDDDCYGIYVDFNGNCGYMVMNFDLEIYEIQSKGDLDYLKNVRFTYFHSIDGFLYKSDTIYVKYEKEEVPDVPLQGAGQIGDGDGFIIDLDSYVAEQYPTAVYAETAEVALTEYPYTTSQLDTSYYTIKKNNTVTPENNCTLTAAFNVISSWKHIGYMPVVPKKNVICDLSGSITADSLYDKYGTGKNSKGFTVASASTLQRIPELYRIMRNYAVNFFSYKPDGGLTMSQIKTIIDYATEYFEHKVTLLEGTDFNNIQQSLKEDRAVFLGLVGSASYGNHAVAALGYRRYYVPLKFGSFVVKLNHFFVSVDDGISNRIVYYDIAKTSAVTTEYIYYNVK